MADDFDEEPVYFDALATDDDPLVDVDSDEGEVDESGGQIGPQPAAQSQIVYRKKDDDRSAEERIADLFTTMAPRKRVLMGILAFVDEPRRADALDAQVEELQRYDSSVYTGYDYSMLLAEAGAIDKVNEDGDPFDEDFEQQPDIVEVDDVKFYKPTDGKQVFWLLTDEGRAYRDADSPLKRLTALLADEPQHAPMFKRFLEYCDGTGRSAEELTGMVDSAPIDADTRMHFSYYAKKLEDTDALVWQDAWVTTPVGHDAIDTLFADIAAPALEGKGE